jgi:hypothetical protein
MKTILIIGIVMFSLNILADIIVGISKLLGLDEFDDCHISLISDTFWLVFCIVLLKQI